MPATVTHIETKRQECPRTLALIRGPIPGFVHVYAYTGKIPCTGPQACLYCGQRKA